MQELRDLNQALVTYIRNSAALEVSKLAIQKFMYTGLVAAVAAPMVLASFSSVIDTPWGVALNRAVKVTSPPACCASQQLVTCRTHIDQPTHLAMAGHSC